MTRQGKQEFKRSRGFSWKDTFDEMQIIAEDADRGDRPVRVPF
jgi:hypothetical protein